MSETELPTGRESMERELGGRVPMPEWTPAPDEPKEYARGDAGIVDAANDQTQSRGSTEDPLDILVDKRQPKEGGRPFYTTVEDAAHDLSTYHQVENATQAAENLNELAAGVDRARAWAAGAQQPQPDAQLSAQAETPQPIDSPQPEAIEQPSTGIDPDFAALLEKKPQLRAQLEAPFAQVEAARQAFAGATAQVAEIAGASVLAAYPELNGLNNQERAVAPHLMQTQNPQRFAEIQGQLNQVNAIYGAAQRAKYEQAQRAYGEFQQYGKQQDAIFENATKGESKETIKAAGDEIVNFAKEQGVSQEALAQLYATNPVLRSAVFQQIMLGFAKHRMAQRTATANPASRGNIPPVQRPGIAPSAGERSAVDVGNLRSDFKKASGNEQLRLAVKLQQAQRRARG